MYRTSPNLPYRTDFRMKWNFKILKLQCFFYRLQYSVQFSASVVSDFLQPHGLQHARPPCPSPTPGACPNSYPLSWWCHPTISTISTSSSCLQSFPASRSFPVSQFFTSKYWRFSFSISPFNEYSGLISFIIVYNL